jgi:Trk K+ transport system NAD-binding subunit
VKFFSLAHCHVGQTAEIGVKRRASSPETCHSRKHPDRLPNTIGITEWLVIGMGRTRLSAYQAFCRQDKRVLGLDADPIVIEALLAEGRRVVYGDAEDKALWDKLPLAKIKGVILAMPEFEVRASAIKQLKTQQFQGHIGSVCFQDDEEARLYSLGASFMINPLIEAGKQLIEQMLRK